MFPTFSALSQSPHIISTPTVDLLLFPAFPAPFTPLLYTKIRVSSSTSINIDKSYKYNLE